MLAQHRETADIDGKQRSQLLQSLLDPIFAVVEGLAAERIRPAEKGPADATGDALIDTHFSLINEVRGERMTA